LFFDYLNSNPATCEEPVDWPIERPPVPGEDGVDFDSFDNAERNGWGSPTAMYMCRTELARDASIARAIKAQWQPNRQKLQDRETGNLKSAEMLPLPPFASIGSRHHVFAWRHDARQWLEKTERLVDVWCCPQCRHFFLAEHGNQAFCLPSCRPDRPPTKRDRAAYMRRYRQLHIVRKRA
jgi:hypothetical protein